MAVDSTLSYGIHFKTNGLSFKTQLLRLIFCSCFLLLLPTTLDLVMMMHIRVPRGATVKIVFLGPMLFSMVHLTTTTLHVTYDFVYFIIIVKESNCGGIDFPKLPKNCHNTHKYKHACTNGKICIHLLSMPIHHLII